MHKECWSADTRPVIGGIPSFKISNKICHTWNLAGSHEKIDLGDFPRQGRTIPLWQTARNYQSPASPPLFHLGHAKDLIDGFLFRGKDKCAGIDNNDRCFFRVGGNLKTVFDQSGRYYFRIYKIFRTSQTYYMYLFSLHIIQAIYLPTPFSVLLRRRDRLPLPLPFFQSFAQPCCSLPSCNAAPEILRPAPDR